MKQEPVNVKCSFCGNAQENVKRIIAGPGVFICDECIKVCNNIIEDEFYSQNGDYMEMSNADIPKPEQKQAL